MTSAAKIQPSRLADLVGSQNVMEDPRILEVYTVDGMLPAAVARPDTAEEAANVVRFAAAENLSLIPCAARTKLCIGMPPARYDLALDLSRMNRVLSHDPGDLTLSVEPGISLAALADSLAAHRQFLPLAAPFFDRATIGGTLTSGVDSALRQRYGTARDFLLGAEFVPGDGALAKSGGRVVKNVSGFDLHKLLIGSLGSLAVITRLNFKTFPLPAASAGFLAQFSSPDQAFAFRAEISRSPISPATLEILSPQAARRLADYSPGANSSSLPSATRWLSSSNWLVAAGVAGSATVLDRSCRDLTSLAEKSGAIASDWLEESVRPLVWNRLREAIPAQLASSPSATILKIAVRPSDLGRALDFLSSAANELSIPHAALIRAAGIIHFALLPASAGESSLQLITQFCETIWQRAHLPDFHATIPWCPAELKRHLNIWGPMRADFSLHQRIKRAFDPQNILSPGRFLGGL